MHDENSFKSLNVLLERIACTYHRTLTAFYLYQALDNIEVTTVVGEVEAGQNVDIVNNFQNFFITTKISLQSFFMINLANFFDEKKGSLCLKKIINKTESEIKELNVENFKECNLDRECLKELVRTYQGIQQSDLNIISALFNDVSSDVEIVKTYRDQWFAHDQLKKGDKPDLADENIEGLFSVISEILNILNQKLNLTKFDWSHVKETAKDEVEIIFKNLRDYEPIRIANINKNADEEWQKLISQRNS